MMLPPLEHAAAVQAYKVKRGLPHTFFIHRNIKTKIYDIEVATLKSKELNDALAREILRKHPYIQLRKRIPMPVRIARRLPVFDQILFDCLTRGLVCDYADVYMSCVIPINTFFLLVICKAHIDILRLADINRSPRVGFRFLRVYVNARTWFPELCPAQVNPKPIFCAGYSRPVNMLFHFCCLYSDNASKRLTRTSTATTPASARGSRSNHAK
jgi:hypothetical protein